MTLIGWKLAVIQNNPPCKMYLLHTHDKITHISIYQLFWKKLQSYKTLPNESLSLSEEKFEREGLRLSSFLDCKSFWMTSLKGDSILFIEVLTLKVAPKKYFIWIGILLDVEILPLSNTNIWIIYYLQTIVSNVCWKTLLLVLWPLHKECITELDPQSPCDETEPW